MIHLDLRTVIVMSGVLALLMSTHMAGASQDLAVTSQDSVFFDVLGMYVINYPVWWCIPIRFALLLLAVKVYGGHVLRRDVLRQAVRVWLTMFIILMAAIVVGWTVSACLRGTTVLPRAFVWYGHALSFAMWCLTLLIALSISHWMLRTIDQRIVWDAFWLGQATTCLVVSIAAPEFSHVLSIPGTLAILLTLTIRSVSLRTVLATTGAGVMLIPMQHLLAIALGPASGALLFPAFVLIAMPMLPATGRLLTTTIQPETSLRNHNGKNQ